MRYVIGFLSSILLCMVLSNVGRRTVNDNPYLGLTMILIGDLTIPSYVGFLFYRGNQAKGAKRLLNEMYPSSRYMDISYMGLDKKSIRAIEDSLVMAEECPALYRMDEKELLGLLDRERKFL
jgi:hypothetical protein